MFLLFFRSIVLPGIAFSLDLIETTKQYGVAEVLIASFMAGFIFSVFGAQPLTIAGVTGPITVFNKTVYDILSKDPNPPIYLHFIGWVYLWAAMFHWVSALLNWCNFLKYVTVFSCDTFGFYVSWVYLQYGVQVITRQVDRTNELGLLASTILAILMLVTYGFLADYGMPISLVAASAMAYWGYLHIANPSTLPVGGAFQAANGRKWLVRFWQLDGKWVGIALPFGFVLWVLFFFDHNVSSLMAQGSEFPLKKPSGFHYDFFLLGICTFIAGLIGVPAPNGLIPQAPIHTTSLLVMERSYKKHENGDGKGSERDRFERDNGVVPDGGSPDSTSADCEIPVAVVEQRVSNLAQGALCLVLLTGPFLQVLKLIPRGVLAGLFWYMGIDALQGNGITKKLLCFIQDKQFTPRDDPLRRVRKSRILLFVSIQLVAFGTTFAVTQTIAAIGFPIIIMLLIPLRVLIITRLPTASPFTMESVGGSHP
ncbi:HCO3 transporter family-domain-containing protein [Amanita rubescens]|nr:HCO3 transporter family-domain-containing protein [Amanita rubescens]